jgi:hypothetical protein
MTVSLSYSPEPGGGTFSSAIDTYGLDSPMPRFGVINVFGGTFATINSCPLDSLGDTRVSFNYAQSGTVPNPIYEPVAAGVSITVNVTTNSGGSWLSASIALGFLSISVSPGNLAANAITPYTGTVQLSATGNPTVVIPVTLTVYPPTLFSVTKSHSGNAVVGGQLQYSIQVTNIQTGNGQIQMPLYVNDVPSSGLTITSMSGTGWNCSAPSCMSDPTLSAGQSTNPIVVTVNVASNATSPQLNTAYLDVGGYLQQTYYDTTIVTGTNCTVTQDQTVTVNDVQYIIGEALGQNPPTSDLNFDGVVNAADVQIVIDALLSGICIV